MRRFQEIPRRITLIHMHPLLSLWCESLPMIRIHSLYQGRDYPSGLTVSRSLTQQMVVASSSINLMLWGVSYKGEQCFTPCLCISNPELREAHIPKVHHWEGRCMALSPFPWLGSITCAVLEWKHSWRSLIQGAYCVLGDGLLSSRYIVSELEFWLFFWQTALKFQEAGGF